MHIHATKINLCLMVITKKINSGLCPGGLEKLVGICGRTR